MAEHILKSHNKTLLLYHLVFPAKYRKEVFSDSAELVIVETDQRDIARHFAVGIADIMAIAPGTSSFHNNSTAAGGLGST